MFSLADPLSAIGYLPSAIAYLRSPICHGLSPTLGPFVPLVPSVPIVASELLPVPADTLAIVNTRKALRIG